MQKKYFYFVILGLVASLGLGFGTVFSEETTPTTEEVSVLNEKIAEKRNRIKELEASIEEYKKKIAEKRLESVSLSNQIAILDNRLLQVELDIELITNKLDTINLEIETINYNIADKEASIARQKEIIAELLRTIHQNEGRSYVEILSAYDTFSDFYNRLQYLQTVERDLGKSARALRIAKEELQLKKDQKEEHKKSYEKLNEELNQRKKDLLEQTNYKSQLLAQTQSSELKYKTLVGSLKAQYQQIENEITGIEQEVRRRLEAQNKLDDIDVGESGLLAWPTQSRYITATFNDPDYPYRHIFEHNAIDIRAGQGTPLKAAASGYVARAKTCTTSSCYSYVMIVHSGGISTVYGHMSKVIVSADQFVARGDVIGYSGGTPGTVGAGPFVTGPHLHFEVRKDGIPVNPLNYLPSE